MLVPNTKRPRVQWLLSLLAAILAGTFAYCLLALAPASLRTAPARDAWFDADIERVSTVMTTPLSPFQESSRKHPLYTLLTEPAVKALRFSGLPEHIAVDTVLAGHAALFGFFLSTALQLTGVGLIETLLLTILALSSAAFVFFASIPETFVLSAATICFVLAWALLDAKFDDLTDAVVAAISLSITVTNFSFGLLLLWAKYTRRYFFYLACVAFSLVAVVWSVEKHFYLGTEFFTVLGSESQYAVNPSAERATAVITAAVASTLVAPKPVLTRNLHDHVPRWPGSWPQGLTMQGQWPAYWAAFGALALWIPFLLIGLVNTWRLAPADVRWVVLGGFLVQMMLHLIYGFEPFLYSLHWLPLLLVVVAYGLRSIPRLARYAVIATLIVFTTINNWHMYDLALGAVPTLSK